jgi:hypothetical protein
MAYLLLALSVVALVIILKKYLDANKNLKKYGPIIDLDKEIAARKPAPSWQLPTCGLLLLVRWCFLQA